MFHARSDAGSEVELRVLRNPIAHHRPPLRRAAHHIAGRRGGASEEARHVGPSVGFAGRVVSRVDGPAYAVGRRVGQRAMHGPLPAPSNGAASEGQQLRARRKHVGPHVSSRTSPTRISHATTSVASSAGVQAALKPREPLLPTDCSSCLVSWGRRPAVWERRCTARQPLAVSASVSGTHALKISVEHVSGCRSGRHRDHTRVRAG